MTLTKTANNFEFEYKFYKNEDERKMLTISIWEFNKRKEVKIFDFLKSVQEVETYLTDLENRYPNISTKREKIFEGIIIIN